MKHDSTQTQSKVTQLHSLTQKGLLNVLLRPHSLQLVSFSSFRNPRNPLLRIQLSPRLRCIQSPSVIHNTSFDDNTTLKSLSLTEKSGSTIWAEVAGYRVSTIGCLGEFFWCSLNLETLFLDDDVGAVRGASDLLTV
jgi:hypothetical protein